MPPRKRGLVIAFLIPLILGACSNSSTPTPALTLTPTPSGPTTTTPTAIQKTPLSATSTLTLTLTSTLSLTETPGCDQAELVESVTIPDNTEMAPGAAFTKIWRLLNTGDCPWNSEYNLVLVSGEGMGAATQPVTTGAVWPGQMVDVSVRMTAPLSTGAHQGNWKLRNASGEIFGVANTSNQAFWVRILIVPQGGIFFDFLAHASEALWVSGAGNLTFADTSRDQDGYARLLDRVALENGRTSSVILATHPQKVSNGVISGRFPLYIVQPGDKFIALLGFLAESDGSCGAGEVEFQLNYREEIGPAQTLGSWEKSCDGSLMFVEVNLSHLAGKTIHLILAVKAIGPATQDWAIWSSPRIEG